MYASGQTLKTFTTSKGNIVVFRTPIANDLKSLTDYANEISREDTFIAFAGEQLTKEEEKKYLDDFLSKMEKGDGIKILGFLKDQLLVNADVTRETRRSKHYGILGISIKNGYRNEGLGTVAMELLVDGAKQMGLRMIELGCFANNPRGLHLYEKFGFKEVGRIPGKYLYKGEYIDSVEMVKEL